MALAREDGGEAVTYLGFNWSVAFTPLHHPIAHTIRNFVITRSPRVEAA